MVVGVSSTEAAKSAETKQKVIVNRTKVLLMLACITKPGSKEKQRKNVPQLP
jgi:hypothetical protein